MSTPISKKILTRLLVRSYRFIKHMNSEYLRERGYDQIKIGHVMVMMNLNESEQADLIRFAFIEMLKRGVEEGKKYEPISEVSVGNATSGGVSCKDGTLVT